RRLRWLHRVVRGRRPRGGPPDRRVRHPAAPPQGLLRRTVRRARVLRRDRIRAPPPACATVDRLSLRHPDRMEMMKLSDLDLPSDARILGDPDRAVGGVSQDSRQAAAGDLWAALPGARVHGASFAAEVLGRGVDAVLTDARGLDL